jgi:molybdenum cofactor cytidylyltransferase
MSPVGILLAAGRGRRFDPSGIYNKLMLPLDGGEPVVAHSARALLAALPRVVAVIRPDEPRLAELLQSLGCEVTECIDADTGMAASLVHAIRTSLPQASAWVVALGDMPRVQSTTITALADALAGGAGIAAPQCQGKRGNPVAFSSAYLHDLLALQGDQGGRAILKANPVVDVDVADFGIFHDIDTASDLTKPSTFPRT